MTSDPRIQPVGAATDDTLPNAVPKEECKWGPCECRPRPGSGMSSPSNAIWVASNPTQAVIATANNALWDRAESTNIGEHSFCRTPCSEGAGTGGVSGGEYEDKNIQPRCDLYRSLPRSPAERSGNFVATPAVRPQLPD